MTTLPTENLIKLRAITFAQAIITGASPRNIDDIAAYGDFLRHPERRRAPVTTLQGQFYRALSAAETEEYRAFTDGLDEAGLTLLENEIAKFVARLVGSARRAARQ